MAVFSLPNSYEGTTSACLPSTSFPSDSHVSSAPNHWANKNVKKYIEKAPSHYLSKKRQELKLPSDQRAFCIFDNFNG